MKTTIVYNILTKVFLLLSAISLLYVALLALINPQAVMDLIQVKLTNTSALSSIRGIYGGVGITIVLTILFLTFTEQVKALIFISVFWGSYAVSRLLTWILDGALGEFGNTWLVIESLFCLIGLALLFIGSKMIKKSHA